MNTQTHIRNRWATGRIIWALCCGLIVALAGCDDVTRNLEPDSEGIPIDSIITLQRMGEGPLRADSVSRDTLVATLPIDAAHRMVTFSTTAGAFPLVGNEKQVTLRAEREEGVGRLIARVEFRSSTTPADAIVSATVAEEWTRRITIPLE